MFSFCLESIGIFLTVLLVIIMIVKLIKCVDNSIVRRVGVQQWAPNTWAVITGCTDGIGLCYAQQLASKGYHLVLISRNPLKLENLKHEIQSKHSDCLIKVLALDFTRNDIYDEIETLFNSLDEIHVLINNVGMTLPNSCPEFFTQIPESVDFIMKAIQMNVFTCTRLIHMILPKMEVKGRGVIINMSSYTALFPMPLLSVYSATKAFVDHFSRSLQAEYESKGIVIQSVLPFYVSTNMIKNVSTNWIIPSPDQFVRSALKTVGFETRTHGYWSHTMIAKMQTFASLLFGTYFNQIYVFNHFRELRRRLHANEDLTRFSLKLFIPIKS